jgi:hypothetical protein
MAPAPVRNTASETDNTPLESGQTTPIASDAGSVNTGGSTTRFQRMRQTLAYDPFNQKTSIERYDAWRERARIERRQKLKKALAGTTERARGVMRLGPKQQSDNANVALAT